MKSAIKLLLRAAALSLLALALAPAAEAQRDPARDRDRDLRERELEEQEAREASQRELRRRALEDELSKPAARRGALRRPATQVADDFLRLQVVNDDLAQALAGGGELDFKLVARSASDIRKLGGRLKLGLMLPEPKAVSRYSMLGDVEDAAQLKSLLSALDKLIVGFVRSPVFKEARVFNSDSSAKAGRDLAEIIELSDRIRKGGEKLSKAARKTP